jgi:hypothetical protein
MPDINKKMETALIPMELAARLRRASADKGIPKSDIIQLALSHELSCIQLTSADYQWMADEVKKNEFRRNKKTR